MRLVSSLFSSIVGITVLRLPRGVRSQAEDFECVYDGPDGMTDYISMVQNSATVVPMECVTVAGEERCFYVYVPECAATAMNPVPLLLDIHGARSCPYISATYTGWYQKADEECFVVAWPIGRKDKSFSDNACFHVPGSRPMAVDGVAGIGFPCCCFKGNAPSVPDFLTNTDDLDFLRTVVVNIVTSKNIENSDAMTKDVTIDPKRVYMAGHSNGCMAGLSVAAEHSDIVAAVCCHSGNLFMPIPNDGSYEPVPVMMIHGEKDSVVPYNGKDWGSNLLWPQIDDTAKLFADNNNCDPFIVETDVMNGAGTRYRRSNCDSNADVEIVALTESGHVPFKDANELLPGIDNTNIDTTSIAWEFCSSHAKVEIPNVFRKKQKEEGTTIGDNQSPKETSSPSKAPSSRMKQKKQKTKTKTKTKKIKK